MVWKYVTKNLLKVLALGLLCAVAVYVAIFLILDGHYGLAVLPVIGALLISYIMLSERQYPIRWLVPGLIFLIVMVVYPIGYTFVSSFTNVGTGHMLSRQQAIDQLLSRTYTPEGSQSYTFDAFEGPGGELELLLVSDSHWVLYLHGIAEEVATTDPRLTDEDGDGAVDRLDGYRKLSFIEIVRSLSTLEQIRVEFDGTILGLHDPTTFRVKLPLYAYNESAETMTNQDSGLVYTAQEGIFTSEDGAEIYPGYRVWTGLRNYADLIRNPQISGPFGSVFLWTIVFATLTVLFNFALGLFSAILLNDPFLRFRTVYRVLCIVPYAIPAFVTILIWRGMLNEGFGIINQVLVNVFGAGARVPWLQNAFWARASLLLVNLWLGYPYMLIISLGALQSIPGVLYEAAKVDGASWWQRFRKITLPLLLMPLAPLLIGAFAFNFNNFTLVWLLTEGRPAISGAQTPAGATDILISYTYRLAFEGARGNQLGLAAAVSVVIFLIVATISAINFRMTGALEELSKNV